MKRMVRKTVSHFWLQPTTTFPEGAPQREEYGDDAAFSAACDAYDKEWRAAYVCGDGNCQNRDCPQHWPNTGATGADDMVGRKGLQMQSKRKKN